MKFLKLYSDLATALSKMVDTPNVVKLETKDDKVLYVHDNRGSSVLIIKDSFDLDFINYQGYCKIVLSGESNGTLQINEDNFNGFIDTAFQEIYFFNDEAAANELGMKLTVTVGGVTYHSCYRDVVVYFNENISETTKDASELTLYEINTSNSLTEDGHPSAIDTVNNTITAHWTEDNQIFNYDEADNKVIDGTLYYAYKLVLTYYVAVDPDNVTRDLEASIQLYHYKYTEAVDDTIIDVSTNIPDPDDIAAGKTGDDIDYDDYNDIKSQSGSYKFIKDCEGGYSFIDDGMMVITRQADKDTVIDEKQYYGYLYSSPWSTETMDLYCDTALTPGVTTDAFFYAYYDLDEDGTAEFTKIMDYALYVDNTGKVSIDYGRSSGMGLLSFDKLDNSKDMVYDGTQYYAYKMVKGNDDPDIYDCVYIKEDLSNTNLGDEVSIAQVYNITVTHISEDEKLEMIKDSWYDDPIGVMYKKTFADDAKTETIQYDANADIISSEALIQSVYAYQNKELVSIELPDTVTTISNKAFYECTNLESITIPETVKYIGTNAFFSCSNLTYIALPDNITYLGCIFLLAGLETAKLPANLIELYETFCNCRSLTSITIPDTVKIIGFQTFSGCTKLVNVNIPKYVEEIQNYAFYNDACITTVTFPVTLKKLYPRSFEGCKSLATINYEGTMEQWKAIPKVQKTSSTTIDKIWWFGYYTSDIGTTVVHCSDGDASIEDFIDYI